MQRTFHAGVGRNLSILTARWERDIIYRFYPVIHPPFEESLRKAARVGAASSTWIPRTSEKQAPGRRSEQPCPKGSDCAYAYSKGKHTL